MLMDSGFPQELWPEAAKTPCYLLNRSPTVALNDKVPIQVAGGIGY